ncbi:grasp-with-spasm system ATP-grasp peptide maturase [Chitinophaga sp. CC14]|uniref:grasp-with-spasm system ATP-grasp peptide maturase n=1 Tax=Chitinophaga TaxID=79328 RepID=UPI000DB979B2|nr:grasp-with-spasm system ATP-grasp peptide maturase [Chitinophaga ginsengisegetis]MDR6569012.1 ATP-GRASP peptide maturase of grasp-with-spasm system [Chitinophaga ginsengisegetis]MDR6648959.1 ATP-GRASP peptide maturase of grasp-with-spasm system [Chitinophaga ginsengisegetis]MDR6655093.1 ATP-GRASP peptide maturase of grasp-with-spasm system [Chitinophaga ginsengisegetis]
MSKQILILSQSHLEGTTDHVCQWMNHLRIPYLRVNGEDFFHFQNLDDLPGNNEVAAVWYRRKISSFPVKYSLKQTDFNTQYTLKRFLVDEFNGLHSLLFYTIDRHKWLNDPISEDNLNKLHVLSLARQCGISTPFTEVVTTKAAIMHLLDKGKELIVKPVSECIFLEDAEGGQYKMLTKTINNANLHLVPEKFFPSLVQEKIIKKFEIRTFYLDGACYSMAIFSQNNRKTKDDFRNYDNQRPNRTVPYKLPADLEQQLDQLMKSLRFRTGSIDLMVDMQGNYHFLEINPEGQFGMVSYPCNYYLEKKLAELLHKNSSHEKEIHQ